MNKNKIIATVVAGLPVAAMAQGSESMMVSGSKYWAAGFAIAVAVALGTYSQSRAASSALGGIARNPGAAKGMFVPLLLSLALMESLVLFAFIIANNILG